MGVSILGQYPLLKIMQWMAKESTESRIRREMPLDNLDVFINADSNKNIDWEEPGEEFHFKGNMYDVVKKENKDGKTFYYCYNDKTESGVFTCMEELVSSFNENHTSPAPSPNCLLKLLVARIYSRKKA